MYLKSIDIGLTVMYYLKWRIFLSFFSMVTMRSRQYLANQQDHVNCSFCGADGLLRGWGYGRKPVKARFKPLGRKYIIELMFRKASYLFWHVNIIQVFWRHVDVIVVHHNSYIIIEACVLHIYYTTCASCFTKS